MREDLRAASLDALIVTSPPNLAYLTGLFARWRGDRVAERLALLVDGRYVATAKARQQMLDGIDLVMVPQSAATRKRSPQSPAPLATAALASKTAI